MKLVESILTKNPCYKAGRTIPVKGLMLHSVGCNQPSAKVFIKQWNSASYDRACVHAFIDGDDGTVYQTLPWDRRGWHAGGAANNTHIGVEMCEPSCITYTGRGAEFTCSNPTKAKVVVKRTYEAAVELFAMLCKQFDLDPLADGVIISHAEGSQRGVASNHADPSHLWDGLKTGYTMEGFRKEVKKAMGKSTNTVTAPAVSASNDKTIWDFFKGKGFNDFAVAGIMGNLEAESGLKPTNLQNSYNKKLNISDEDYTRLVDGNNYPDFTKDKAGYGLAQWTFHTRKQGLLEAAKAAGKSIGDLGVQLDYLWKELQGYKGVMDVLQSAQSVQEASDVVLTQFEKPANQSDAVKKKRASYGQKWYDKYAGKTPAPKPTGDFKPYLVKITASALNVRRGAGTNYPVSTVVKRNEVYTIVGEQRVGDTMWGKLKSGAGWISLAYVKRV